MITRSTKRICPRALMIDDELGTATAEGRAVAALVQELTERGLEVVPATSAEDGHSAIVSDSAIHTILIDWTLDGDEDHSPGRGLIQLRPPPNQKGPILLKGEGGQASSIPIPVME